MLYTVGHSTLPWEDFLRLIEPLEVVIDVRSHPGSRWPQYNRRFMREELGERYQWWPALGGWTERHLGLQEQFPSVDLAAYSRGAFPKQRIAARAPAAAGPAWTNQGLLDFAWYTSLPEFLAAADRLLELSDPLDLGILCCECLYYKCHRSMIADYAVWRGADADHLILAGRRTKTTRHSTVINNRLDRYPRPVLEAWRHHADLDAGVPREVVRWVARA